MKIRKSPNLASVALHTASPRPLRSHTVVRQLVRAVTSRRSWATPPAWVMNDYDMIMCQVSGVTLTCVGTVALARAATSARDSEVMSAAVSGSVSGYSLYIPTTATATFSWLLLFCEQNVSYSLLEIEIFLRFGT